MMLALRATFLRWSVGEDAMSESNRASQPTAFQPFCGGGITSKRDVSIDTD